MICHISTAIKRAFRIEHDAFPVRNYFCIYPNSESWAFFLFIYTLRFGKGNKHTCKSRLNIFLKYTLYV